MQVAGFTGSGYEDFLTLPYLQAKPTRAHFTQAYFYYYFFCITWGCTRFYRLACNIFFDFSFQAVCQLGIFNLPVGLA
jgi:hypothetical protein